MTGINGIARNFVINRDAFVTARNRWPARDRCAAHADVPLPSGRGPREMSNDDEIGGGEDGIYGLGDPLPAPAAAMFDPTDDETHHERQQGEAAEIGEPWPELVLGFRWRQCSKDRGGDHER